MESLEHKVKSLSELLSAYSQVRLALPSDNQTVLELLRQIEMQTDHGGLRWDRGPDFFSLARAQGRTHWVFLALNRDGTAHGVGVISLAPWMIHGRRQICAYTSDLRFSRRLDRAGRLQFWRCYSEIVRDHKRIREFSDVDFFYSCVLDENRMAIQSFVESKEGRPNSEILYRWLQAYSSSIVLGAWGQGVRRWWAHRRNPDWEVVSASSVPQDQWKDFWFATQNRAFSAFLTFDEVQRRLSELKVSEEEILFVRSRKSQQLLAVAALATDHSFRRAELASLPGWARWITHLSYFLGMRSLSESKVLQAGYLSFFAAVTEHCDELRSWLLREHLQRHRGRFHFVIVPARTALPNAADSLGGGAADSSSGTTTNNSSGTATNSSSGTATTGSNLSGGFITRRILGTVYEVRHREQLPVAPSAEQGGWDWDVTLA